MSCTHPFLLCVGRHPTPPPRRNSSIHVISCCSVSPAMVTWTCMLRSTTLVLHYCVDMRGLPCLHERLLRAYWIFLLFEKVMILVLLFSIYSIAFHVSWWHWFFCHCKFSIWLLQQDLIFEVCSLSLPFQKCVIIMIKDGHASVLWHFIICFPQHPQSYPQ